MTLINRREHKFRIHDNDGEIDFSGHIKNRRISLQTFDNAPFRVNRIDISFKTVLLKSFHDIGADRMSFCGSADYCNGAGFHDLIEVLHVKSFRKQKR